MDLTRPPSVLTPATVTSLPLAYPRRGEAYRVLGILMILTFFSLVDRQIPNFLVGPIRGSLGISDTQISLIQGSAFAIIFSLAALPFGWLVDHFNRRNIIFGGATVWSAATIYCGFADSFWALFAARVGVGIGEAALAPAVYSLIADYVMPDRRGRTMAIYFLSASVGSGAALILIGYVVAKAQALSRIIPMLHSLGPWQIAFVLAGLPGLALAPAVLAIREPVRRTNSGALSTDGLEQTSMAEFIAHLRANWRTFLGMYAALGSLQFCNIAGYSWMPTFGMREYGLKAGEVGLTLGMVFAAMGLVGGLASAAVSDRMAASKLPGGRLLIVTLAFTVMVPLHLIWPLAGRWSVSVALFAAACGCTTIAYASAPAIIQDVVPNRMRGKAIALYMMINGLVGYGLGPTAVALITDYVFHDDHALKYSLLLCMAPGAAVGLIASVVALAPYARLRQSLWS